MPVVILKPAGKDRNKLVCKSFKLTSEGYEPNDKINEKNRFIDFWTADQRPDPSSPQEMLALLNEIESDRHACLVFGVKLTALGNDELEGKPGYIRKWASDDHGDKRRLEIVPSRVLPIDIDHGDVPLSNDPQADMRALINWALPAPFQAADAVYQFSNSCGLKTQKMKGHLFFILQEPRRLDEVKLLAKSDGWIDRIDDKLFNPAQLVFTARPRIIDSSGDPIEDDPIEARYGARCGLIEGNGALNLPQAPKPKPRPQPRKPTIRGGDEETARKHLELTCSRLAALADGQQRRQSAYNYAWQIGGFVGAGRLDYQTAYESLLWAADKNGSTQDHRNVHKEIEKGLKRGQAHPLEARSFSQGRREMKPSTRARASQSEVKRSPSTQAERSQSVRQAFSRALKESASQGVAVLKLPTGVGKTYGALIMAAEQVAQGRSVIFASRDNTKAEAAERELKAIIEAGHAPHVLVERIESKSRICDTNRQKHYQDNPTERTLMAEMRREGVGGSHLCEKLDCPARFTCSVYAAAKVKRELEEQISICTHAMLPHLKQQLSELDERALLIIDEAPAETFTETVSIKDLEALLYEVEDSKARGDDYSKWRCLTTWRGISRDIVRPLIGALKSLSQASARGGAHSRLIEPEQLYKAVKSSLKEAAARAFIEEEIEPPPLALQHYRRKHKRLVKPSALRALRGLITSICEDSGDAYRLRFNDSDGAPLALERWSSATIPTEADVIVLDATASRDDWEHVCQTQGRKLAWIEDESIEPHEMPLLWWQTGAYKTKELFNKRGISKRGTAAINNLALFLEPYLKHLPDQAAIGIGTHLKLQKLIDEAQQGKGALNGSTWQRIMGRFNLVTGHHHADEVGSNALRSVQYLIIIGTPRFDHAHRIAQGRQLGLSQEAAEARAERRAQQSLEQWVGRLRHYVEAGKRTIYAGDLEMNPIKGVIQSHHAAIGRPTAEHSHEIERTARAAMSSPEGLSKQMLYNLGASAWITKKIWSQLKAEGALEVKKQVGRRGFIILRSPQVHDQDKALESKEKATADELARPLEESAYNNIGSPQKPARPLEESAYNKYRAAEGGGKGSIKLCALSSNGQSDLINTHTAAAGEGELRLDERARAQNISCALSSNGQSAFSYSLAEAEKEAIFLALSSRLIEVSAYA
jgi:hypothetical protein